MFAEVSARCYGGLSFGEVGERAPLRSYAEAPAHPDETPLPEPAAPSGGLHLVCYKPLFSGAAVERVPELQFQRPAAEIELSPSDAAARGVANGAVVHVSAGGVIVELRARVSRTVRAGVARVAQEHAGELLGSVEVTPVRAGVAI